MDNEIKVEEGGALPPARRSVDMFLRDMQLEMSEKNLYNLDEEFAKTKKNKNPLFWLTLSIFVAFFAVLALLITWYIQNQASKVAVNIQGFEDVNLKDVLDKSKGYENEMKFARRELEELVAGKSQAMERIRTDYSQRIELARTSGLSQEETDRRIRGIRSEQERSLSNTTAEYDEKIRDKEAEIADIQAKMDSYDSRLLQKAKEQEELLNNQQKLFDIKLQNSVDYYENLLKEQGKASADEVQKLNEYREKLVSELKQRHAEEIQKTILTYNPQKLPGEGSRVVAAAAVPKDFRKSFPAGYDSILVREGVLTEAEYAEQKQTYEDMAALIESLKSIPYINAVPGALSYAEYIHAKEAASYSGIWPQAERALKRKDNEIKDREAIIKAREKTLSEKEEEIKRRDRAVEQLMYAISAFQKSSRENGFILDPRNQTEILLYVDPVMKIKAGDSGYVFRTDDNYIGMVKFTEVGTVSKATVTELADTSKPILPFDKILLNIK